MKKTLALVLAVMMLATLAFASRTNPGTTLKWTIGASGGLTPVLGNAAANNSISITGDLGTTSTGTAITWATGEITSKTFSVTNVKWTRNSALVDSITVNDDGQLAIKLKQNYAMAVSTTAPKYVEGTFKITQKGKSKTAEYDLSGAGNLIVGYESQTFLIGTDTGSDIGPDAKKIIEFDKGTVSYETINFADAMGNDIDVRIYDGEELFLYSETDPDLDVVKKYDDSGAELDFISFPANPTFSSTATYYIYADEDQFVYAIKNGAVVASGAKWDDDLGCWTLKARTLGAYVISDIKLSTAAAGSDTPIPDTGANDVVGIAAALAVVALVSAAAVSLKK